MVSKEKSNDANIVANRLENIVKELSDQIRNNPKANLKQKLALPDNKFLIDIITQVMTDNVIAESTSLKKRIYNRVLSKARFFEHIRNNGGLFSSSEAAAVLGVSKVTVKKKKDENKILALYLNSAFVYPAFQFSEDNSEKGILKGIAEVLPNIASFSDVMQYGFFAQKLNVLGYTRPDEEEHTIIDMLKNGITDDELKSIIRLSKTFGSQDPY